jgi:ABC-type dipeptide/oligopeptide/nickel transport system permease component
MAVSILVALPLGVLGALYRGQWIDQVATTVSLLGVAMPNFWLGPLLAIVFAVSLGWLPVSGTGRGSIWCCRPSRLAGRLPHCWHA